MARRAVWTLAPMIVAGTSSAVAARTPDRTPAASCRVIEVAYAAAIDARDGVFPVTVKRGDATPSLADYEPQFREDWPLTGVEYDHLVEQEKRVPTSAFEPRCVWQGRPQRATYGAEEAAVSFTRPVFAIDRKLAIVEVAFEESLFGHGMMCVAGKAGARWSARCVSSWVS